MHHVVLNRAGTDDRNLDHEVIERAPLQPGQLCHLRAGLDLEHADRVRLADHGVGGGILRRHAREIEPLIAMFP